MKIFRSRGFWCAVLFLVAALILFVSRAQAYWFNVTGVQRVGLFAYNNSATWSSIVSQPDNADGVAALGANGSLAVIGRSLLFNGTGWDRWRRVPGRATGTAAVALPGREWSDSARNLTGAGTTTFEFTTSANELLDFNSCAVFLDSAAGSGTSPTLNVYIQTAWGGTAWGDRISFSQVTTAASKQEASVTSGGFTPVAQTDGTLAAGSIRDGTFSGRMRVKYVVAGTSPVFNPVTVTVNCK
jgi:hypothetical protein